MTRLFRVGWGRSGDPDLKFINKEKPAPDRRFFPYSCHQHEHVIPNAVRDLPDGKQINGKGFSGMQITNGEATPHSKGYPLHTSTILNLTR
jgi:hypothetical protein